MGGVETQSSLRHHCKRASVFLYNFTVLIVEYLHKFCFAEAVLTKTTHVTYTHARKHARNTRAHTEIIRYYTTSTMNRLDHINQ